MKHTKFQSPTCQRKKNCPAFELNQVAAPRTWAMRQNGLPRCCSHLPLLIWHALARKVQPNAMVFVCHETRTKSVRWSQNVPKLVLYRSVWCARLGQNKANQKWSLPCFFVPNCGHFKFKRPALLQWIGPRVPPNFARKSFSSTKCILVRGHPND